MSWRSLFRFSSSAGLVLILLFPFGIDADKEFDKPRPSLNSSEEMEDQNSQIS
jgi:hypothetical protein